MSSNGIWKVKKLGDICDGIYSGGTPKRKEKSYWDGVFNWLASGETRSRYIKNTQEKITQEGIKKSSTRLACAGDIVLASAGQGNTRGQVSYLLIDTYINQSIICFSVDETKIHSKFLYYNLDSRYSELRKISDGNSIRGSITTKMMKDFDIFLPPLSEQMIIANLLSSLDDKIENNNAIIANLEAQAQTIFKSWFVDFEFPDENEMPYKSNGGTMIESQIGRIPEIWRISTIENFSDKLISGGTPSRKIDEYWNDGHIPWLKTQEINNGYITQVEEKITNEGLNKSSAKWVKKDSIAIAMYGASAGRIAYLGLPTTTNQACCVIESDYSNYIYEYLLNKQKYISSLASGSAQQNLSKKVISEIKIINPSHAILEKYETHIKVNTRLILNLIKENTKLAEIREMILPKLMSGEIRVGDVDTVE